MSPCRERPKRQTHSRTAWVLSSLHILRNLPLSRIQFGGSPPFLVGSGLVFMTSSTWTSTRAAPPCPLTPQQFSGEGWHPLSIWGRLVPFPRHGCSGHSSLALRVVKTQPRPGRRPAGHADRTLPESQRLISKCFVPLRLLLLVLSFDAVFGSVHARFVKSCV